MGVCVNTAAGAVTEAELSAFVKKHQLPLVIPFNEENAETIFGAGIDEQVTTIDTLGLVSLLKGERVLQ